MSEPISKQYCEKHRLVHYCEECMLCASEKRDLELAKNQNNVSEDSEEEGIL